MVGGWTTKRILMTVKTYPTPAWKGGEVVCAAGITDEGEWIRLFPIPYRLLNDPQRFKKYQWIEARVTRAREDTRLESYRVDIDSIRVVSVVLKRDNHWQARKEIVLPLESRSMCQLQAERDANGFPTLGIFQPRQIKSLRIEPTDANWSESELARLNQLSLIVASPRQPLEKIPFMFKYWYTCREDTCRGHKMLCTDWEMSQAYRSFSQRYEGNWESKFHNRFELAMIKKNDTHFYVGTIHGYPSHWIIVGLFYPMNEKI